MKKKNIMSNKGPFAYLWENMKIQKINPSFFYFPSHSFLFTFSNLPNFLFIFAKKKKPKNFEEYVLHAHINKPLDVSVLKIRDVFKS